MYKSKSKFFIKTNQIDKLLANLIKKNKKANNLIIQTIIRETNNGKNTLRKY